MQIMKKLVAAALSASMCMAFVSTVWAGGTAIVTGSDANVLSSSNGTPTSGIVTPTNPEKGYYTNMSGTATPVTLSPISEPVQEVLEDPEQVKDILTDAGFVVDEKTSVVVLAAYDFNLQDEDYDGKITIPFSIWDYDVEDGDTVYALHQLHTGTWEVLEGTVKNNEVVFELDSLSPIALIKVMSDGEVVALPQVTVEETKPTTEKEEPKEEPKVETEKKSPKTGE